MASLNFHELLHALVSFLLTLLASGDLTHLEIEHVMVLLLVVVVELRLIKRKNEAAKTQAVSCTLPLMLPFMNYVLPVADMWDI